MTVFPTPCPCHPVGAFFTPERTPIMSSKSTSHDFSSYVQVDVRWIVGGIEAHALSVRTPTHRYERYAYDAHAALSAAAKKIPDTLSKEIERPTADEAPARKLTAAESLIDEDGIAPTVVGPEHVFTTEEMRRYYAVLAAGSCSAAGSVAVEGMSNWILNGDDDH